MRTILFLLLAIAASVQAQTISVRFYGTNNTDGLPAFWPAQVQPGTNSTQGWVLMSKSTLENIVTTNRSAYEAWESNKTWTAQKAVLDDLAPLITAYSNLQWVADNFASVTNLNTLRTAVKAEGDVLLKLKPVLRALYESKQTR